MKKLFTLVIALVSVLSLCALTACGNKTESNKLKVVPVDLSSEQYAFAMKKESPLKATVDQFMTDKAEEIKAIMDKYLNATDLEQYGTTEIKTASTDRENELVIATNLDFAPFEYKNGAKIAGIDMEIAQLLATYMNKTLVVINMDFEAVVTSVQTKDEYDLGIAGLTITDERLDVVDFSAPYFDATQVIVVKETDTRFDSCKTAEDVEKILAGFSGKEAKCGGQTGTTSQFYCQGNESLEFDGFSNLDFKGYASAALACQDMLNGNISFVIVDKATGTAVVRSING